MKSAETAILFSLHFILLCSLLVGERIYPKGFAQWPIYRGSEVPTAIRDDAQSLPFTEVNVIRQPILLNYFKTLSGAPTKA